MKKILISLLIVLLLILCIVAATNGLPFGIPSIGSIIENNKQIDDQILQATTLASTDYENIQKEVEKDIKKLEEEKKKYDDLVSVSTGGEVQAANQYQKYEIEYLWTIIGNHAKKEGVVIKMDLQSGTGENVYNLNFTVTGIYIGISDFVSDIENDSALGFKIENFSLVPSSSTDTLKATFVCKDITIRDVAKNVKSTNKDTESTDKTTDNTTENSNKTDSSSSTGTNDSSSSSNINNSNSTNNSSNSSSSNSSNNSNSSNSNSSSKSTKSDDNDISEEDFEKELNKLDRD